MEGYPGPGIWVKFLEQDLCRQDKTIKTINGLSLYLKVYNCQEVLRPAFHLLAWLFPDILPAGRQQQSLNVHHGNAVALINGMLNLIGTI
jgi:hypothetical protein